MMACGTNWDAARAPCAENVLIGARAIGEAHNRIKGLNLGFEAEEAILSGNASKLLKL
jgi:hypothetical protein